eukprot:gene12377-43984_t
MPHGEGGVPPALVELLVRHGVAPGDGDAPAAPAAPADAAAG